MKALAGALYAADSELSSSKMRSWMCGGGGGGGGSMVCVWEGEISKNGQHGQAGLVPAPASQQMWATQMQQCLLTRPTPLDLHPALTCVSADWASAKAVTAGRCTSITCWAAPTPCCSSLRAGRGRGGEEGECRGRLLPTVGYCECRHRYRTKVPSVPPYISTCSTAAPCRAPPAPGLRRPPPARRPALAGTRAPAGRRA